VHLASILEIGVNLLQSHEARTGITIRVNEKHWKSRYRGMLGTVEHKWGHPDHPALDVRLEDGRLELFWFHELDKVQEKARTA
jgi:hypothetical protein